MIGVETQIEPLCVPQTLHEQTGYDQEDQGSCDLRNNERASYTLPSHIARAAAIAIVQNIGDVDARRAERRHDPHGEARYERRAHRIAEHAPVEVRIETDRQVRRQIKRADEK